MFYLKQNKITETQSSLIWWHSNSILVLYPSSFIYIHTHIKHCINSCYIHSFIQTIPHCFTFIIIIKPLHWFIKSHLWYIVYKTYININTRDRRRRRTYESYFQAQYQSEIFFVYTLMYFYYFIQKSSKSELKAMSEVWMHHICVCVCVFGNEKCLHTYNTHTHTYRIQFLFYLSYWI